jgi:amino acid transporter
MAEAKKFGAFAGVFTPSILSILGVIMYLRLGWVVGEAGLLNALVIILLAHVISVTTGLSVSSIATDKKIKGGGIYYMLSRSLGLPMGGAIGILIFIATSLSIALYMIGFAENFLSVAVISSFFNLGTTVNDIRIVGTGAILVLVIIAYISTSLAIKSQYIVLGAIAISIAAIITGLFLNVDLRPEEAILNARPGGLPFEAVFAIFFPAVTGFTVGVAMSGDLKDPGKSIPKGTMWAIGTGMVVYIGLAILFALKVNRDMLLSDYNFLSTIALWAPLVIAGVWAATLSSGLGGILGAPRIMQALSLDKIMPRIFGKGFGINNEPRNALILTFILAEIAILIGELNIVARIATMFYIAAYGFINLSYTLESWASPDFRPSFRIPKWVSITGFLACFGIMFQLDAMAMILSVIAMFLVYMYLSKKELRLDYGDVWQSVWSSVVRSSLNRIANKGLEERNWQPNIVLFSGGTAARPHLIEFGRQLIGSQGLLSNFDLIQTDMNKIILPRHKQTDTEDALHDVQGFFSRKHFCADIYEGIKTIASIYGFSGIEPNTVMLGWARQSQEPEKFIQTINYIKALDLNILLMDYDKNHGFGKYNQIDIWWRTAEHNGNLGLLLLKFLRRSEEWRNAKARILIVNPINDQKHVIFQNTKDILENLRIKAEIKVINNQIDQRSFYDIVQVESVSSDLIFLGLPEIESGKEEEFVEETNTLCKDIGTAILMKASTTFKKLNIGAKTIHYHQSESKSSDALPPSPAHIPIPDFDVPGKPELLHQIRVLHSNLLQHVDDLTQTYLASLFTYQNNLVSQIEKTTGKHVENLQKKLLQPTSDNPLQLAAKYNTNLWLRYRRLITDYNADIAAIQVSTLSECLITFRNEVDRIVAESPVRVQISLKKEDLKIYPGDNLQTRLLKIKQRLSIKVSGKDKTTFNIKYQRIVSAYLESAANQIIYDFLEKWGTVSSIFMSAVKTLFNDISIIIIEIEKKCTPDDNGIAYLIEKHKEMLRKTGVLEESIQKKQASLSELLIKSATEAIAQLADEFNSIKSNNTYSSKYKTNEAKLVIRKYLEGLPDKWLNNQKLLSNAIMLELGLISLIGKIKVVFTEAEAEIGNTFEEHIINRQREIKTQFTEYAEKVKENPDTTFNLNNISEVEHHLVIQTLFNQLMQQTFNKIKQAARMLPERIELMDQDSQKYLSQVQFKSVGSLSILVSRLIDFMLQSEFVEPLQGSLADVSAKLLPVKTSTNEIIRSLDFRLNPDTETKADEQLTASQKQKIIVEHVAQLDMEIKKAVELKKTILKMFRERLNTFEDKLTFYSFIENANNLKNYIRQREIKKRWHILQETSKKSKTFVQYILNQYWYRQSTGTMLTRKLLSQQEQARFRVNDTRSILDQISLKPHIDDKLPFYYKQLFIRKQYYLNEFWSGREKELHEAELAIQRYRSGLTGAILVTGDHHAGKTFFSQYFVNKFYPDAQSFTLTPPYAGSSDLRLFRMSLENLFEINGSYYKIFNSLPENSVLIIDDLALWWEQSERGFAVVAQLIELIDKYSSRCLFVVNLNKLTYGLMRRMNPVDNYFISIIELSAFSTEELQNIILTRHESGNLRLRLHNRMRDQLRPWDYARLFSKYYSVSGGNVGVALQYWLANIEDVKDNTLFIRSPQMPDISALDTMESGWYLLIIQLLLHKRANLRKLARIMRENVQEIKETIDILLRAGIVEEKNPGVYELNTLFYPFLLRKLNEKDMI